MKVMHAGSREEILIAYGDSLVSMKCTRPKVTISEIVSTLLMDREATTHLIYPNNLTQK